MISDSSKDYFIDIIYIQPCVPICVKMVVNALHLINVSVLLCGKESFVTGVSIHSHPYELKFPHSFFKCTKTNNDALQNYTSNGREWGGVLEV